MKKSEKTSDFLGWILMVVGLFIIVSPYAIKNLHDFLYKIDYAGSSVVVLTIIITGIIIFFIGLHFSLQTKEND